MMKLKKEICNAFNGHAQEYDKAAIAQLEIGKRLIERLHYLKITPSNVLDLGCGSGVFLALLNKHYPKAKVIGLDFASHMLYEAKAKQKFRFKNKAGLVQGDMESLPFARNSFDLIFANQSIHWSSSYPNLFSELYRVLNTDGCLMFSTLGPDTFWEVREAWRVVNNYSHVNHFPDMHDVGDSLLHAHFIDPVVDMEILSVHYASLRHLLYTLRAQGVKNIHENRNPGLTSRNTWKHFEQEISKFCVKGKKIPLTYEVVYGHAWKGQPKAIQDGNEIRIPLSSLRKNSS